MISDLYYCLVKLSTYHLHPNVRAPSFPTRRASDLWLLSRARVVVHGEAKGSVVCAERGHKGGRGHGQAEGECNGRERDGHLARHDRLARLVARRDRTSTRLNSSH